MSKHTPEPWRQHSEYKKAIIDQNGIVIGTTSQNNAEHLQYADAARIIACVNACATFDNDTLLDDGPRKLREDRDQLLAQRDELLEALELFTLLNPNHYRDIAGMIGKAVEVVNKVKGGQP